MLILFSLMHYRNETTMGPQTVAVMFMSIPNATVDWWSAAAVGLLFSVHTALVTNMVWGGADCHIFIVLWIHSRAK